MSDQQVSARATSDASVAEVQRNVELQAQILARVTDGVNIVSADGGRIVYVNSAFETMFGYGPGELIGQSPDVLNAPEAGPPESTAESIIQALKSSGRWQGDLLNRRKDGSTFWTFTTITTHDLPQLGCVWMSIQRDISERKAAEVALAKSELRYRTLFDSIDQGYCVIQVLFDDTGTPVDYLFEEVNPAFEQHTGIDNTAGRTVREIVPEPDPHWIEIYGRIAMTGHPERFTNFVRALHRWYDIYAFRIGDAEERRVAVLFNDITAHKEVEKALTDSEQRLRTILEKLPVGVGVVDAQGRFVLSNAMMRGYSGEHMPSSDTRQIPHWEGRDVDGNAIPPSLWPGARALRGEVVTPGIPFSYNSETGTELTLLVSAVPYRDSDGQIVGAITVAQDITARHRAEATLAQREAMLRAITENSPDEIFFLDRAHGIEYLNPAGLEFVRRLLSRPDLRLGELIGRPTWAFLGENDLTRSFRALDEQVMANGETSNVEDVVDLGDGRRTRLTSRSPIRNEAGTIVGLVGVARDITTRKREETERLTSLERQRDALVQEVHHRIKNHLHGVVGLLRQKADNHPDLSNHLVEVMDQIRAIANVYGLYKGGEGTAGVDLDHMIQLITASAADPVDCVNRIGGPLSLPESDAVPMALVVNELVTNALKHRARPDPAKPVQVRLEMTGEVVLLTVSASPARLPSGFDFEARLGLGTGLELVATLLPTKGVSLAFLQAGDEVSTELRLNVPYVSSLPPRAPVSGDE